MDENEREEKEDEAKENLWAQVCLALDANDEDRAFSLAKELSTAGDPRGSYAVGCVFQRKALRLFRASPVSSREYFVISEHWYNRALSQGGNYFVHHALAKHYYFGDGGKYDFKLAHEHLQHSVEYLPEAKMMMAELLFLGIGAPKDVTTARTLFGVCAAMGYPGAIMGLCRIEWAEKNFIKAARYYFHALRVSIKWVVQDKDHPLLLGAGGRWHTFRLDWYEKMGSPLYRPTGH